MYLQEFLEYATTHLGPDFDVDVRVRPYWHFCDMCRTNFSFVGKLETMAEDEKYIWEKANVNETMFQAEL